MTSFLLHAYNLTYLKSRVFNSASQGRAVKECRLSNLLLIVHVDAQLLRPKMIGHEVHQSIVEVCRRMIEECGNVEKFNPKLQ